MFFLLCSFCFSPPADGDVRPGDVAAAATAAAPPAAAQKKMNGALVARPSLSSTNFSSTTAECASANATGSVAPVAKTTGPNCLGEIATGVMMATGFTTWGWGYGLGWNKPDKPLLLSKFFLIRA